MPRLDLTCRPGGQSSSYHKAALRPREVLGAACMAAQRVAVLGLVLACAACAGVGLSEDDALVTGSITPRPIPVSAPASASVLEGTAPEGFAISDWQLAKLALEQALSSSRADVSIPWENSASGAHGTATPIGKDWTAGCRDFMISLVKDAGAGRWAQGTACRAKGQVVLSQVRMLGGA